MYRQPRGYKVNGQLKECDRCGFAFRWTDLRLQNGLWLDRECLDKFDRRFVAGGGFVGGQGSS